MVRWFKLFGNQYLGFWLMGLVLFAVQEIPYMLMPLFRLETNPIMNMTEVSTALDACEKFLGSLCIALMVFVIHKDALAFSVTNGREKLFFTLAVIILLANFFRLGAVLCRPSEHFCDDAFYRNYAAAVLCGHRSLAAKHAVSRNRDCIPGSTLLSCAGKSAWIVTVNIRSRENICFRQATRGICCFVSVIPYTAVLIAIYRIVSSSLMLFQDGSPICNPTPKAKYTIKSCRQKEIAFYMQ